MGKSGCGGGEMDGVRGEWGRGERSGSSLKHVLQVSKWLHEVQSSRESFALSVNNTQNYPPFY